MSKFFVSFAIVLMLALPAAATSPRVDEVDGGGGGEYADDVSSVVPEPGAGLVFAAGALVVAAHLRRRRS